MIPSSEHDVRSSVSHGRVPAAVLVAVAGTWISTVVLLIVASELWCRAVTSSVLGSGRCS